MVTFIVGLVALTTLIAVVCMLYAVIDLARDLGPRGCMVILIVVAVFGLLAYGGGALVQPIMSVK